MGGVCLPGFLTPSPPPPPPPPPPPAIAGPITGSLGAAAVGAAAVTTDSQLLFALADFGYMINLFNLLPIGSLDGGRIANAIHPLISCLGIAGGGALLYTGTVANPIFYLIMASGTFTTGKRLLGYEDVPPSFYQMPFQNKAAITSAYLGLIGCLIAAQDLNSRSKKTPRQLGYRGEGLDEKINRLLEDDDEGPPDADTTVFRIE